MEKIKEEFYKGWLPGSNTKVKQKHIPTMIAVTFAMWTINASP